MLEDRFECWSECKEGFVKGISFDNGCGLHCRFSGPVIAKVTGPCGNCHTMHNSQGGTSMTTGYEAGSGPYGTLLRANGCLGCHAATGGDIWQGVGGGSDCVQYVCS